MRSMTALSLILALCFAAGASPGDDSKKDQARWPQFRGPGGRGAGCEGLRLPAQVGRNQNLIWKTPLPAGHSSPCVWGDRIYVTGFDAPSKKLETLCLDRADGKVLWRRPAPADKIEHVHEVNTPASSTPATDGEQVYVYFASYGLLCYDKQGTLKWKLPLEPIATPFGSGTSPVVAGDYVLLNSGQGQDKLSLLAFDRRTGKLAWRQDRPRGQATGLWSTPVVSQLDQGGEVIVAGGQQVAAYNLADGAPRWQVTGLPFISLGTPAIGEGLLFLTLTNPVGDPDENVVKLPSFDELLKQYDKNKDGKLSADELPASLVLFTRGRSDRIGDWANIRDFLARYDKDNDKALNRAEWQAMLDSIAQFRPFMQIAVLAIRLDGKGDISKTHIAWKYSKQVPEVPSPLYHQGRVYLITEKGIVVCREARSGREIYRERLPGRGNCYSSPVVGDGKIYIGTDGGSLVVLKPGDRFQVLARNDLGEGIMATPALVDDRIYVRTDRHLYAFGEGGKAGR